MGNNNIEDIYPLSPLQQGMLFHSLYAQETGVYFEQSCWHIDQTLDLAAFKAAWQSVVDRHTALRSAFAWEGLDEPLQVVFTQADVPLHHQDWSSLSSQEIETRLAQYLQEDRQKNFDLSEAPLLRVAVLQTGPAQFWLVWSHHHLLLDGWSATLVLQEVFSTYLQLQAGRRPALPPAPPYRNYISWLKKQDPARAETFWRKYLANFSTPAPLKSLANAHPLVQGEQDYLVIHEMLPASLAETLQAFARKHHLTLNSIFQGMWAVLINRYTGEEDIVYGAIVSSRPAEIASVEEMVGLFINTLPVRAAVQPAQPALDFLKNLQEDLAAQREYDYCPLVEIQNWSSIPHDHALFDSIVVFENYPVGESLQQLGQQVAIIPGETFTRTNYPLTMAVSAGKELGIELGYDRTLFSDEFARRLLQHLQVLLTGVLQAPQQPLGQLSLLTEMEKQRMLVDWNRTEKPFPADLLVQALFEEQAMRSPDAVALRFEGRSMTYAELDRQANQLAQYLRSISVGPDQLVGICLDRSFEMVIAVLGVLKSGGAFVPLDPAYPSDRLSFMAVDAALPVLITRTEFVDRFEGFSGRVVCLDQEQAQILEFSGEQVDPGTDAENLAYVIYTSGSTGKPKGTLLQHRGLVNFVTDFRETLKLQPESRLLQFASFSFDAAVCEIFITLSTGAVLVLARRETLLAETELTTLINAEAITHVILPPSLLRLLAAQDIPGVKVVASVGEACSPEIVAKWSPGRDFFNGYGPTETTIGAAISKIVSIPDGEIIVPIGKPLANLTTYVLDAGLQPVPVGIPGELFIGGVGLAVGYLNRPELTREKFISNPIKPSERIYRTGDRVRWREDGQLEFLGRTDQQVKLRGFRVELGEIENCLLQNPSVRQAAVLARGEHENKTLVAFVEPDGPGFDLAQVKKELEKQLPVYMVPGQIVMLDQLPLSAAGKVDRKALAAVEIEEAPLPSVVAPRTPVEQGLAELFMQVLRRSQVGIYDDFFALGGHSLSATQLNSRIRQIFGVDLPLAAQFEFTTIAALAERVEALLRESSGASVLPLVARQQTANPPLSFPQQRLWFLDQLAGPSPAYNIPFVVRLTGSLDIEALQAAFQEINRRHSVLRSYFTEESGKPVQSIVPEFQVELPIQDLSGLSDEQRQQEQDAVLHRQALEPFDLSQAPLMRLMLLRLSDQEHILSTVTHHIISDGWSMNVFVRELVALYSAYQSGQPSPLPDLPVQYADFAAWQQEQLGGERLEAQLSYWHSQLGDHIPVLELPTDYPRPAILSSHGGIVPIHVPDEVAAALQSLGQEEGATLFMVLLAAFQVLLSRYSNQDEFAVGSPIANRNRSEIEGLIGFFVNTLVIKADLTGSPTFRELLSRVREFSLGAYAHQDLPFEMLVERMQPERDLAHTPLFQVAFGLVQPQLDGIDFGGMRIEGLDIKTESAKFDLTLEMSLTPDGLGGTLEYNADLFEPATIEQMTEHLLVLLQSIVADPDIPVSSISLVGPEETSRLVNEWGQGRKIVLPEICIHSRFEEHARTAPQAPALIYEGATMTYAELDAQSNRLANRLVEMGVRCGDLVGVSFDRGFDVIIAILAVQKAGGAYIPLDPTYPPDRLAFMLEDSHARALITHSRLKERLPNPEITLCLDQDWEALQAYPTSPPANRAFPDDLAYVIYTSGSTGRPKGALLHHRGLVNLSLAQRSAFSVTPSSRILQFSPLSFDASVWEMAMSLANGAALVLASQERLANPEEMVSLLAEEHVTHVTLPPSMLRAMPEKELPDLKTIVAAGEACPLELVQRWGSGRQFVDAYGPTETTVCASMFNCDPADLSDPPIGRPIDNFELYVLDNHQQLLPAGVPGELCIGGAGLARGYLNRPELSAEKFIAHPFKPGARLYRSGDLVRWRSDGNLMFLGRIDQQVKLRGFRIELGEIEAALRGHPLVADVAALVRRDRLIAYLVLSSGEQQPSVAELRAHLRLTLPEYMVPQAFVYLEELPLSPSGKIDRKALPDPEGARPDLERPYVPPRNDDEAKLAGICAELLELDRVGVEDSFFELGGHSLLATQLVSRIREAFEIELPLRAIFEYPTIGELAGQIQVIKTTQPAASNIPAIKAVARDERRVRRPAPAAAQAEAKE